MNLRSWTAVVVAVLLLMPAAGRAVEQRAGLDERLGAEVPLELQMRDELGRPVRLGELLTGPTILAPVYYRCSNVCNALQAGLAQALPRLPAAIKDQIRVISFSFDPGETPALARGSKKIYRAVVGDDFPMENWSFLTADAATIARLTDAIGYRFYQQGTEFVHPVAMAVLSPEGKVARYLLGTRILPTDLSLALMEASDGRVGSTISRLASFCYSYDPQQRGYVFNFLRMTAIVVIVSALALFAVLMFGGRRRRRN